MSERAKSVRFARWHLVHEPKSYLKKLVGCRKISAMLSLNALEEKGKYLSVERDFMDGCHLTFIELGGFVAWNKS